MSICFLSLESSKVFNKLILEELEKEGFDGLSEALVVLFPYIDTYENITIAKLSKHVGYSRQAMHKNIKKLEDFGYITLTLQNQKEKGIKFTPKSLKLLEVADTYIKKVENEISSLIGQEQLDSYKSNQMKIHQYLSSL